MNFKKILDWLKINFKMTASPDIKKPTVWVEIGKLGMQINFYIVKK